MTFPDTWFRSFVSLNRDRLKPAFSLIISDSFWPSAADRFRPEADIRYLSLHPLDRSGADLKHLLAATRSIDEKPEVQFSLTSFSGMPA